MKPSRFELGLAGLLTLLLGGSLLNNPGLTGRAPGWTLVVAGLLCVAVGLGWEQFRGKLHHKVYWIPLALLLWSYITATTSIDPYLSKRALATLTCGLAVMWATALAGRSRLLWRRLTIVAVALAVLSACAAWLRVASQGSWEARLAANFTNPDSYAVVLLVGFCLTLATLERSKAPWSVLQALAAGLLLVTLIATQSRSAVAGLLAVGLVFLLGLRGGPKRRPSIKFGYLPLVLAPTLAFVVFSGKAGAVSQRLKNLAASPFDLPLRAEFVEGSVHCAQERPLLGSGPGTFSLAYQEFRPLDTPTQEFVNVAHNDTLQFLVETGLPGAVLWLALLFFLLQAGLKSGKDLETVGVTACLAGLFAFSLFNFILPLLNTAIWFFFVAGLVLARTQASEETLKSPAWNLPAAGFLVVAGIATLFIGFRHWMARDACELAIEHRRQLEWRESLAAFDHAIALEPKNSNHRLHRAQTLQEMATLYGREDWLLQVEHDLSRALQNSPRDPLALSRNFRYFLKVGQVDKALETAERAHRYAPYSHRFRQRLAGIQVLQGKLKSAGTVLKTEAGVASKALASIIFQLERDIPGEGVDFLIDLPPEEQLELLREACLAATKAGDVKRLQRFHLLEQTTKDKQLILALTQAKELRAVKAETELRHHLTTWSATQHEEMDGYEELLLLMAQTEHPEASTKLLAYLSKHPERAEVRLAASRLVSNSDAIALIDKGLELTPRRSDFLIRLADLYAKDQMTELAKDYYQRGLAQGAKPEMVNRKLRQLERNR